MEDFELQYSWSNGKYWSPYNHCRVWSGSNDSSTEYTLKVRDQYGQEVLTETLVTNLKDRTLVMPTIELSQSAREWSSTTVTVTVKSNDTNCKYIYRRTIGATTWTKEEAIQTTFSISTGVTGIEAYYEDVYGNISPTASTYIMVNGVQPTNLNFNPTVDSAKRIFTEVSAVSTVADDLLRYSISYDNGQTWSDPQIGKKFCLVDTSGQSEYMVNCRAHTSARTYNSTTGKYEYPIYTQGTAVKVTVG